MNNCLYKFNFRIDERFLIFLHIFVSPGSLWSPLRKTKEAPHNFSLWAFFFFSIWLGSLVFLRGLQREPGETKICTKRIRNLSSIRKLVKTIIHHLKCKYSVTKTIVNLPASFLCFLSCVRKTPQFKFQIPRF